MDDYLFEDFLAASRYLPEANSYIEIFNYSDSSFNSCEQHSLEASEVQNFLHRNGAFAPKILPPGVKLLSGMRLVLQVDAKQNDTFKPSVITLPHDIYRDMVKSFNLSYQWIETSAAVGPLFWTCWDQDDDDPHLQIIYRKSDVLKKTKTRGWELSLSHEVTSGITQGFYKGTNSSDIKGVLKHLHRCTAQVGHAMLLPIILFGHDMGLNLEMKQRDLRHESRKLENAISMRGDIEPQEGFVAEGIVDYDLVNQVIIECSTQVLWKNPTTYQEILNGFRKSFRDWESKVPADRIDDRLRKLQTSLLNRIDFYYVRLEGMKEYAETTTKRLNVQKVALEMNTSRRENKLNLEIAFQQRQLIHTTKRETEGQKTIATLGIIFLPPTVISGIFSTTFFNFGNADPSGTEVVSRYFWVFWAITLPVTVLIYLGFLVYTHWRQKLYEKEDAAIANSVEELEKRIQKEMRVKTITRLDTFNKQEERTGSSLGGPGTINGAAARGAIANAIAGTARAGASMIGMNSGKSTMTGVSTVEPAPRPVMGEAATLASSLQLRPSGKASVHSRSPSRGRRALTPDVPDSEKPVANEDAQETEASSKASKEAVEEAESASKSKKRSMRRRKTTATTTDPEKGVLGEEDDRSARQRSTLSSLLGKFFD